MKTQINLQIDRSNCKEIRRIKARERVLSFGRGEPSISHPPGASFLILVYLIKIFLKNFSVCVFFNLFYFYLFFVLAPDMWANVYVELCMQFLCSTVTFLLLPLSVLIVKNGLE